MIRRATAASALLAMLAPASACAASDSPAVATAAEHAPAAAETPGGPAATVDAFHAALGRGDTAEALTWLADDALVFEEGRAERSKSEYASHHLAADAAFSQAVPAVVTRRSEQSAGILAWTARESRVKGAFRGQDVDRLMVETMVLRRSADGWRIVHIHWSSAQPSTE